MFVSVSQPFRVRVGPSENPDLCAGAGAHRRSLGYARDDKGEGGDFRWGLLDRMDRKKLQVPRFAPTALGVKGGPVPLTPATWSHPSGPASAELILHRYRHEVAGE